jgi:hypothetical protein
VGTSKIILDFYSTPGHGKAPKGILTTTGRILFYNSRTKITDVLFRISSMTNSMVTGPPKPFQFQEIPFSILGLFLFIISDKTRYINMGVGVTRD